MSVNSSSFFPYRAAVGRMELSLEASQDSFQKIGEDAYAVNWDHSAFVDVLATLSLDSKEIARVVPSVAEAELSAHVLCMSPSSRRRFVVNLELGKPQAIRLPRDAWRGAATLIGHLVRKKGFEVPVNGYGSERGNILAT